MKSFFSKRLRVFSLSLKIKFSDYWLFFFFVVRDLFLLLRDWSWTFHVNSWDLSALVIKPAPSARFLLTWYRDGISPYRQCIFDIFHNALSRVGCTKALRCACSIVVMFNRGFWGSRQKALILFEFSFSQFFFFSCYFIYLIFIPFFFKKKKFYIIYIN
jgi:hypothetical protein